VICKTDEHGPTHRHAVASRTPETTRPFPTCRSALDEALAPLLELAAPLRTGAERDVLAAYVLRKLHHAWNPK